MSAYTDIYRALTSDRPLSPAAASQLLATHRAELGDELAHVLMEHARVQYPQDENTAYATQRKARLRYGAVQQAAAWLRRAARSA